MYPGEGLYPRIKFIYSGVGLYLGDIVHVSRSRIASW